MEGFQFTNFTISSLIASPKLPIGKFCHRSDLGLSGYRNMVPLHGEVIVDGSQRRKKKEAAVLKIIQSNALKDEVMKQRNR